MQKLTPSIDENCIICVCDVRVQSSVSSGYRPDPDFAKFQLEGLSHVLPSSNPVYAGLVCLEIAFSKKEE